MGDVWSLFCYAVLSVLSSFAIILPWKKELIALLWSFVWCLVSISVLCIFLAVPRVCLQCVIVVFPGQTHLFNT